MAYENVPSAIDLMDVYPRAVNVEAYGAMAFVALRLVDQVLTEGGSLTDDEMTMVRATLATTPVVVSVVVAKAEDIALALRAQQN